MVLYVSYDYTEMISPTGKPQLKVINRKQRTESDNQDKKESAMNTRNNGDRKKNDRIEKIKKNRRIPTPNLPQSKQNRKYYDKSTKQDE